MKATFLNRTQPILTTMVQANTADEVIALIKKSISAGAEALGIQTCRLAAGEQMIDTYRRIFAAAEGLPTYVTHYRGCCNAGKSDETLAEGMLQIATAGATLVDVMGDLFSPHPEELCDDPVAIEKQKRLIDALHREGAEVLMSSHTKKYLPAERVLEIALAQQARGADVVKIVTAAQTPEQEAENLRITTLLKKELKVPFLFLCVGECKLIRRVGPMLGSAMWLSVYEYDACATKVQPLLSDIKGLRDYFM